MPTEYGFAERNGAANLISVAFDEDLGSLGDLTCQTTIPESQRGTVQIVSRREGVLAGGPLITQVFGLLDPSVEIDQHIADGEALHPGSVIASLTGSMRSLLIGERTVLNFLTHLCGVASLTRRFVDAVAGTEAKVLDTRKTLPGWRALQKYAVRCGGGVNHRFGLHDGVIIKDNHVAAWKAEQPEGSLAEMVRQVRSTLPLPVFVELEVDSLEQFEEAIPGEPDWVLLDNFTVEMLSEAVRLRDVSGKAIQLEASGGVTLETVGEIASSGVDRISSGSLTHSAVALDLGFDWID